MRRFFLAVFCALALSLSALAADAALPSLEAAVNVREDGVCEVTMTAEVDFSATQDSLLIPLGTDARDITLAGWSYETVLQDGVTCLKLSNPAGFSGKQQFTCSYTLPCRAAEAADGQQFRLSLPETGWDYAIDSYSLTMTFPAEVTNAPEWTSGYYGDVVDNYLDIRTQENTVTAKSTAAMRDHETLTVSVQFPADTFNLQQTIGMESTAGEIPCQLLGEAPDAAGMIVHWGNLGYLTVRMSRGRVILYKRMEMGNERKPSERRFFAALFRAGASCEAGGLRYQAAVREMQAPILTGWRRRMFTGGNPLVLRLLGAAAGLFASLLTFDRLLPATGSRWVWLPVLTALGTAACVLVQRGVGSLFRRRRALALALGGLSAIALVISGVLAGSLPYQLLSLLLQVFCAGTTLFGGRRTSAGEERLRRLLGLRRYLCRADSASLQRLTLQDPQYFYRMLPFAEEMGVGGRFAERTAERLPFRAARLRGPQPVRPPVLRRSAARRRLPRRSRSGRRCARTAERSMIRMKSEEYRFYALVSRMRYITRWGLMRNTFSENVQEHSHMVAVLAHGLALIRRDILGLPADPERCATAALFHDASEILTGDLPTPVKYYNPDIRAAYKQVERVSADKLLELLPEALRPSYAPLVRESDPTVHDIVKAADKLSAHIKCIEELRAGNQEFASAAEQTRQALTDMHLPELDWFLEHCLDSFGKNLDQLE